ncbi:DUF4405 domain-containing protein [Ancylobacter sonchi]|uniref:DUF4405 domain-containing protein n=1 Tax=Ancylobacter sonchi TaxID=1937790 RepID=UPI001BD2FED8|nr:DUF4405 domain-containing protein [Ancylobacter sonchi]MBS7537063.1 DUF4405 domain-containing protein [Ancylobacter sonchi]
MTPALLFRLVLDLLASGLLLLALAYWWLGNAVHELAGTALLLLVGAHNVFNRRRYRPLVAARRQAHGRLDLAVLLLLATAMLALLATSVAISETLAGIMPGGGYTGRQIHVLAAYWVLIVVAVHLGLRWPRLMAVARAGFGLEHPNAARTLGLRLLAAAVALHGVWSSFELGIGARLTLQTTLDWWNFEDSAAGFFVHALAVAGLYGVLSYYVAGWLRRRST